MEKRDDPIRSDAWNGDCDNDKYSSPTRKDSIMNIVRSSKTYATRANAIKALRKATGNEFDNLRWLIAVSEDGRFVPVIVGAEHTEYCHSGITVVS